MKRFTLPGLLLGLIFIILLCGGSLLLTGLVGWWQMGPDQTAARPLRILPVVPLATPLTAPVTGETGQRENWPSPSESQVSPVSPGATVVHNEPPTPTATATPIPTPSEAEIRANNFRGFALPPNTADSITGAGGATRVVIPELNLDVPVVVAPIENQTWKVDHLGQVVGHLEGTAAPGTPNNLVLAAHVTLATGGNGPFINLSDLSAGDVVYVYAGEQKYEYVIDQHQIVDNTAINVTYPSASPEITLITCSNWDNSAQQYVERLVVKGHLNSP